MAVGAVILAILLLVMTNRCYVIVIATFIAFAWAFIDAYSFYSLIFRKDSDSPFPLLNMMVLVLLLGLGADDILLLYQVRFYHSLIFLCSLHFI